MQASEWPSFREWQTTRLPEPYRTICAGRWAMRDWTEMREPIVRMASDLGRALSASMTEVTRIIGDAIRPAFQQAAEIMANMVEAMRDAGLLELVDE